MGRESQNNGRSFRAKVLTVIVVDEGEEAGRVANGGAVENQIVRDVCPLRHVRGFSIVADVHVCRTIPCINWSLRANVVRRSKKCAFVSATDTFWQLNATYVVLCLSDPV